MPVFFGRSKRGFLKKSIEIEEEEDRSDTQKSYMWLARGGPPKQKVVWYEYQKSRAPYHARAFLEGYSGYLQTDGYDGYDKAVKDMPDIIHVGCFAHARRKFFEAAKLTTKSQSAEEGIKHIRKLYQLEDELSSKNLDDEKFLAERKTRAQPILDKFHSWLLKRKDEVLPSAQLGKAIHYRAPMTFTRSHFLPRITSSIICPRGAPA